MKTSLNIAARSAQMIRAAVKDLRISTQPSPWPLTMDGDGVRTEAVQMRANAISSLDEIANQLDQYSPAFEPASEKTV